MGKFLAVEFSDGTTYVIPVKFTAEHRASYYANLDADRGEDFQSVYDAEVRFALKCTDEILDWAANNMDWSDVHDVAKLLRRDVPADYEAEWASAALWIQEMKLWN